ncbi:hypothetical protein SAMN05216588_105186 [Pseudomonas flavescens]|uniref:Uncharacterized protein n=1 Tax=Phytopseudomonas flavescens TaxID=29435 RepID=A0A1G8DA33_9GAMM|nr:hypothetical protein SAMN05216588_105186 [Pseudomonas flavescens]
MSWHPQSARNRTVIKKRQPGHTWLAFCCSAWLFDQSVYWNSLMIFCTPDVPCTTLLAALASWRLTTPSM